MTIIANRFGGRLHIDSGKSSPPLESIDLVNKGKNQKQPLSIKNTHSPGEKNFPERCKRVWLGATDLEEEGIWRDSETNKLVDLSQFWNAGSPNGGTIQNCAGIWELVSCHCHNAFIYL